MASSPPPDKVGASQRIDLENPEGASGAKRGLKRGKSKGGISRSTKTGGSTPGPSELPEEDGQQEPAFDGIAPEDTAVHGSEDGNGADGDEEEKTLLQHGVERRPAKSFQTMFFEPDVPKIMVAFLVNLTNPVYFLCRWVAIIYRKVKGREDLDVCEHLTRPWCYMCPMQTAINVSVWAWLLARVHCDVSLTEVFLPLWFQAEMSLSLAATKNMDFLDWNTLKNTILKNFEDRLSDFLEDEDAGSGKCNGNKEDVKKVVLWLYKAIDNRSYTSKLEHWQYCIFLCLGWLRLGIPYSAFRDALRLAPQILLTIDLHRKLVNSAHKSLNERMERLKAPPNTWSVTQTKDDSTSNKLQWFMWDYKKAYTSKEGWINVRDSLYFLVYGLTSVTTTGLLFG